MGEPILFVVRVWSDGCFRASVRNVQSDETRLFDRSLDVARYLQQQIEADSIDQGEPR
jgi:hypothetical protein